MSEVRDVAAIKKLTDELDQELVAVVTKWATKLGEYDLTVTFMRHSIMMALHIETDREAFMMSMEEMWALYERAKNHQRSMQ